MRYITPSATSGVAFKPPRNSPVGNIHAGASWATFPRLIWSSELKRCAL
ncbi:MAG: hypothetical protein ACKOB4_15735 [Acidobacteriota bacterium]